MTMVAYAGRDKLSDEAQGAIRDAWRTTRQLRGDCDWQLNGAHRSG